MAPTIHDAFRELDYRLTEFEDEKYLADNTSEMIQDGFREVYGYKKSIYELPPKLEFFDPSQVVNVAQTYKSRVSDILMTLKKRDIKLTFNEDLSSSENPIDPEWQERLYKEWTDELKLYLKQLEVIIKSRKHLIGPIANSQSTASPSSHSQENNNSTVEEPLRYFDYQILANGKKSPVGETVKISPVFFIPSQSQIFDEVIKSKELLYKHVNKLTSLEVNHGLLVIVNKLKILIDEINSSAQNEYLKAYKEPLVILLKYIDSNFQPFFH
jgi:hypothetical protein